MPCIGVPLHLTATDAAVYPFPPTPDVPPACPCHSAPSCFAQGTASPSAHWVLTLSLPSHTHKYICFCRGFHSTLPALLLPVPPFPAWQQGLAGKRGAESPGMCTRLSCSFLLEVEGKAPGARQRGLPPKGRAEIYEGWSSAFRSFLALLLRKSCQ